MRVPLVVFGDLVWQRSLSQVLQVSDQGPALQQGLQRAPQGRGRLGPLHGLHDQRQLVPRHFPTMFAMSTKTIHIRDLKHSPEGKNVTLQVKLERRHYDCGKSSANRAYLKSLSAPM